MVVYSETSNQKKVLNTTQPGPKEILIEKLQSSKVITERMPAMPVPPVWYDRSYRTEHENAEEIMLRMVSLGRWPRIYSLKHHLSITTQQEWVLNVCSRQTRDYCQRRTAQLRTLHHLLSLHKKDGIRFVRKWIWGQFHLIDLRPLCKFLKQVNISLSPCRVSKEQFQEAIQQSVVLVLMFQILKNGTDIPDSASFKPSWSHHNRLLGRFCKYLICHKYVCIELLDVRSSLPK